MRSNGVRMVFGNDLVTSVFHNFAEWVLSSKHHRLKLTALILLNDQNVHLSLTPSKGALPTTDRNRLTRQSFIILYIFSMTPSLKFFPTIETGVATKWFFSKTLFPFQKIEGNGSQKEVIDAICYQISVSIGNLCCLFGNLFLTSVFIHLVLSFFSPPQPLSLLS